MSVAWPRLERNNKCVVVCRNRLEIGGRDIKLEN